MTFKGEYYKTTVVLALQPWDLGLGKAGDSVELWELDLCFQGGGLCVHSPLLPHRGALTFGLLTKKPYSKQILGDCSWRGRFSLMSVNSSPAWDGCADHTHTVQAGGGLHCSNTRAHVHPQLPWYDTIISGEKEGASSTRERIHFPSLPPGTQDRTALYSIYLLWLEVQLQNWPRYNNPQNSGWYIRLSAWKYKEPWTHWARGMPANLACLPSAQEPTQSFSSLSPAGSLEGFLNHRNILFSCMKESSGYVT